MGRPIVIVTGLSGAGKSTLIARATAECGGAVRLKSVTTRPRRDDASDASYLFVTREEFRRLLEAGELAEHDDYNPQSPNLYGTPHAELERVGPGQVGVKDMTEPGLKQLLDSGRYRIRHVRIKPAGHALRSADRVEADEARARLVPKADYEIINDHADPHGFAKALAAFVSLLRHFAADP